MSATSLNEHKPHRVCVCYRSHANSNTAHASTIPAATTTKDVNSLLCVCESLPFAHIVGELCFHFRKINKYELKKKTIKIANNTAAATNIHSKLQNVKMPPVERYKCTFCWISPHYLVAQICIALNPICFRRRKKCYMSDGFCVKRTFDTIYYLLLWEMNNLLSLNVWLKWPLLMDRTVAALTIVETSCAHRWQWQRREMW